LSSAKTPNRLDEDVPFDGGVDHVNAASAQISSASLNQDAA
jgi:hypothetical protein